MADLILWNCLANESFAIRPIGPHRLSSWLRLHGYNVKVIDFCNLLTTDQLVDLTLKHIDKNTIGIGVSTTFWWNLSRIKPELKPNDSPDAVKQEPHWVTNARERLKNKNLRWILGGANSVYGPYANEWEIIHSFGEDSLLKLLDESTYNKSTRNLFDIQTLGNTFYDDCSIQSNEVLPIEMCRGCQFKCSFCRSPLLGKRKNTYIRNFKLIEDELLENYQKFGTTKYTIIDDTFNETPEKVEELANIAQKLPFKLEWFGYNRLDLISSKKYTIDLLQQSGLKGTFFGIESFHPKASKIIGKGWNGVHAKDFLLELKDSWGDDINITIGLIVGLTGESSEDIDRTHAWCKENVASFRYAALHITTKNLHGWESVFDRNYGLYGYKFPNPHQAYWTNKDWNYNSAVKKSNALNADADLVVKPSNWFLSQMSTFYDTDTLLKIRRRDIDWHYLKSQSLEFVNRYYQMQINS